MKNRQYLILAIVLVVLSAVSRLVDHPMNFTPITGLALFSAYAFSGKWKLIVPFAAIILSDIVLEITKGYGFHSGTLMVYGAFAVMIAIGYLLIKKPTIINVLGSAVLASVVFFLITNFALFYPEVTEGSNLQGYPHTMEGVIASYTAGIPFFRNMLLGDVIFTGVLFGIYETANKFIFNKSFA
ncbi:DUF6580 family putative transport protein [Jiulongibacter sp. NS-SX5]|uniref:DUF6580 family putative transport protein n=1 Tax=Jiulongibacter sp. NS-SX5 TaxID=3463854 RepID=UPI004058A72D